MRLVITCSLLSYAGPIVFDNTVGSIGVFEIVEHLLFLVMILSGYAMLRHSTALKTSSARTA